MKHFALITNSYKDPSLALTEKIAAFIREQGGSASVFVSRYRASENRDFAVEDIPAETECIIVLGGDGTLIRAATKVQRLKLPMIGVNLGTLGYLCELEPGNVFDAIRLLMQDQYISEERIMLQGARIGDNPHGKKALNDFVIHASGQLSTIRLNVYVNDEFLTTYNADGIIVATPTGSTGYSLSAGGPIVDPKGNMIILTPSNSHTLNAKSIVLSGEDEVEIELIDHRDLPGCMGVVSCDGDKVCELAPGDRFRIRKAHNSVTICSLHKRSFVEILRKKMELYT